MRTKYCGSRWEKNIYGNREAMIYVWLLLSSYLDWIYWSLLLAWLDLLIFVPDLWIWIKVVIKCGSFETSRCYPFRVTFRYDAIQFKGRIFCIAQTCPCLDFYGGSPCAFFRKPLKLADFIYYSVKIKREKYKEFSCFR